MRKHLSPFGHLAAKAISYHLKNPMAVYQIFKRDEKQAAQFYYDARSEITEQINSAERKGPRR